MSEESGIGVDRRDFMIAAIASAAIAAEAGAANAQGTPPSFASTAPAMPQGTVYTGDVIRGRRSSARWTLTPGVRQEAPPHFQGVQMVTGQHWYVSVIVAKGAQPGKRISHREWVHGEVISPVLT